MLFFALLLALASAQTYVRTILFASASCVGAQLAVRSTLATCTPGTVVSPCSAGVLVDCYQGVPPSFPNAVQLSTFPTNTCSGNPSEMLSFVNGFCVQFLGTSYTVGCSNSYLTVVYFTNTNVCVGQGYYSQVAGGQCVATPANIVPFNLTASQFTFATCTAPCFHESTEISYDGGRVLTLDSVVAGDSAGQCHVPHVLQSHGVSISTSCSAKPLRLTNDHLVYTAAGMRPAVSIKKGDVLFSDMEEKHLCLVKSVTGEANQKYFGLNCRKSDVLANGIKTSVFGITHTIPAAWMNYASRILGVERASAWGDAVVSLLNRWNLI